MAEAAAEKRKKVESIAESFERKRMPSGKLEGGRGLVREARQIELDKEDPRYTIGYTIPRESFYKGLGSRPEFHAIRKELDSEPASRVIGLRGKRLEGFSKYLKENGYKTNPLLIWRKDGELPAVKEVGDEKVLGVFKKKRRHTRAWEVDGHLYVTAHDENAPANLFVNPMKTLYYHMLSKGEGDYESGTKGFLAELPKGLEESGDGRSTSQKLVLADDYSKKDRLDESYRLLENALKKFKPGSPGKTKKMYEAIGRRAERYAEKASDPELKGKFRDISQEAERYARESPSGLQAPGDKDGGRVGAYLHRKLEKLIERYRKK